MEQTLQAAAFESASIIFGRTGADRATRIITG